MDHDSLYLAKKKNNNKRFPIQVQASLLLLLQIAASLSHYQFIATFYDSNYEDDVHWTSTLVEYQVRSPISPLPSLCLLLQIAPQVSASIKSANSVTFFLMMIQSMIECGWHNLIWLMVIVKVAIPATSSIKGILSKKLTLTNLWIHTLLLDRQKSFPEMTPYTAQMLIILEEKKNNPIKTHPKNWANFRRTRPSMDG